MVTVFDIETGPLPEAELRELLPPFDPADVKTGNLGPAKAAEKVRAAEESYWAEKLEKAALSAVTGTVLAIGYKGAWDRIDHAGDLQEPDLLRTFWGAVNRGRDLGCHFVGHNIYGFDLPFLVRRSWALGLKGQIPADIIKQNRYWSPIFIDTMDRWRLGDFREYVKLDTLAKLFGAPGKMEGVTGADFARLFDEDRPRALAYLNQDLEATWQVAGRMGIC